MREAMASLTEWRFPLKGARFVCPACMADEWMEGATAPLMEYRRILPNGLAMHHLGCPDCGLQVEVDFILYEWGRDIPENSASWN